MPELPEVALVARDLSRIAAATELGRIDFGGERRFLNRIVPRSARKALKAMHGRRIRISSFGKLLVLSSGTDGVTLRLGMTGQFQILPVKKEHRRHHFMTVHWGSTKCRFLDFRRFAKLRPGSEVPDGALGGYVPGRGLHLTSAVNIKKALATALKGFDRMPRISWLLYHGPRTGIGNYLANEALGHLKLSPYLPCADEAEAFRLLRACQNIAKASYRNGGTSFGIGYFRLNGTTGQFADKLKYYQNPSVPRVVFRKRPVYSWFGLPSATSERACTYTR